MIAADALTRLYKPLRCRAYGLTRGNRDAAEELTHTTLLHLMEEEPAETGDFTNLLNYGHLTMRSIWRTWGFQAP